MTSSTSATARFMVAPGDTVTAWLLSPVSATYFPGTPALAEDRVNYRFINGFVDVGLPPCRTAVIDDVRTRTLAPDADWPVESINLPGFNRRLEFSGFWHRPTRLARWCRTVLIAPEDGSYRFRLATCGGVTIWVDGELAAQFEPYTRNAEQQTEITLDLKAAGSEILMLSEDMAERDTNWYVELTLLSEPGLTAVVPGNADALVIEELMALAREIRPSRDVFTEGPLLLQCDTPPRSDVKISARVLPSVHMRDKPPLLASEGLLRAGARTVEIAGIDAMPDDYHQLKLTLSVGETRIERAIAFALLRETVPGRHAEPLTARKQAALAHAARHGEARIGRVIALLEQGGDPALVTRIVDDTLAAIDERRDCSDFVLVPLLWVLGHYRDALGADLVQRIERTVLGYRYWVDEPGNDVMWFWSENHVLCFHVSQYLAGGLLPEGQFTASGRSGAAQRALGEERLLKWFDSVEAHGLAEWNSAAYYPIDFIGLLALEHMGDGEIRQRARAMLDKLFHMIALHTLGGVPAGSMGRAYDKELRAGPLTELAPFATVAFGEGWFNEGVAALTMFCAGSYAPPAHLADCVFVPEGQMLRAHYVQGYGAAARLALFKSTHTQLSASVDGTPGAHGHQQHIMDIRLAGHPFARAWVNHPGEDDPWGHQRPSYWAGNGVMPRVGMQDDAILMIFDIPASDRIDFTHAYAPLETFDEWTLSGDWLLLRSGQGFAALRASGPLEQVTEGPGAGREFRCAGRRVAWVGLVGELAAGETLAAVLPRLAETKMAFDADALRVTLDRPDRPALALDYGTGLSVDGTPAGFPTASLTPVVATAPLTPFSSVGKDN